MDDHFNCVVTSLMDEPFKYVVTSFMNYMFLQVRCDVIKGRFFQVSCVVIRDDSFKYLVTSFMDGSSSTLWLLNNDKEIKNFISNQMRQQKGKILIESLIIKNTFLGERNEIKDLWLFERNCLIKRKWRFIRLLPSSELILTSFSFFFCVSALTPPEKILSHNFYFIFSFSFFLSFRKS